MEAARIARGSAEKLIAATLNAWETSGHAALSARGLAQATGLPPSSIYHHFGDIERLYVVAHDHARTLAERWCSLRLEQLADSPHGPESLATLLAALIDDWCERERGLAFAWRECQLRVARDPRYAELSGRWRSLWESFWGEVCARLGIPGTVAMTVHLFDGESYLHMLRWRRLVDRAGLEELCRGWSAWLQGRMAPPAPWRTEARAYALRTAMPPLARDATMARIAEAAVTLLARAGVGGVTHRAVAAEAGLTLGVVSHKFKTSADLLNSAFETIYRRNVPSQGAELEASLREDAESVIARLSDRAGAEDFGLATAELMIAAMRDPALAPFAAQLRYLRGRTSGLVLQALLGSDFQVSALDAAIFSSFSIGQGNAHRSLSPTDRVARGRSETEALLAMLRGGAR